MLPSNSPGVHSLWAPAFALKTPLVLKPGGQEPWTPFRMIQAFIKAGAPPEAFSYYPTDHAGAGEILRRCGRGMVFGDVSTTKVWARDPPRRSARPRLEQGRYRRTSIDRWPEFIDVIAASIAENSGRSCVNASGVWVTKHADKIAEALAARLARVVPRTAEDPEAVLAPFADPEIARRISSMIDGDMAGEGAPARDVSAALRGSYPVLRSLGEGGRVASAHGGTYLLPTVIRCAADHPLANREFLFPFASVVEVPESSLPDRLGPSLVVTCISNDPAFRARFVASPHVDRLNFGALSTTQIGWDQPHEGNLFEDRDARRAIQKLA